jgi:two-component system sensor kinase FixL
MAPDKTNNVRKPPLIRALPLRIALIYGVVSALLFLSSEFLLSLFSVDKSVFAQLELLKDWIFVCFTAVMLYLLIRRHVTAIARSDEALRESEAKFQMLAETTTSAIFIYRNRILVANTAMEKLTGYSRGELLAMTYQDLVHPEFRADLSEHFKVLSRGEAEPLRCEHRIITKSGAERWVELTSNVIVYEGEKAGLGTAFDITDLKDTMNALRESEERLRLLVERVTDYEIFMLDPEGRIVIWNIGAARGRGYTSDEIIGRHHSIFFTPEDVARGIPAQELSEAARTGRFEDEGWRVRKDGSLFWANVVTTALRDEGGRLRGFTKVVKDITERRRAEESLRESEERYRIITESASDAIVTIDEQSMIVFANSAVKKIFGFTPDEITGQPITILMPERFRQAHQTAMERFTESGRKNMSWEGAEFTGLHHEGYELPLEVSYGSFIREGRRYFTGIIRDVSERKEIEREREYKEMLERFNKEIETAIAERTMSLLALKLADRVRNPALVIGLTARKSLASPVIDLELEESLKTILDKAESLDATVSDFQAILKSRQSAFSYEDINDLIREILVVIRPEVSGKKVALSVRLSRAPLRINLQRQLFRAALSHVLRNAVEATGEGGRKSIATAKEGDSIIITVCDTGSGIPKDILGKIFDPLFSTKTRRFGMGLPLVKQIVSEHLGEMTLESKLGRGTTVRMVLPVRWKEGAV